MNEHLEQTASSPAHEPLQTDVGAVWRTGAVIAGVVIGSFVLIIGLLNWLNPGQTGPLTSQPAKTEPNWAEQRPLQRLRTREHEWLHEYAWVDPAAGVARIPVDRAMEIVAQTGLQPLTAVDASSPSENSDQ